MCPRCNPVQHGPRLRLQNSNRTKDNLYTPCYILRDCLAKYQLNSIELMYLQRHSLSKYPCFTTVNAAPNAAYCVHSKLKTLYSYVVRFHGALILDQKSSVHHYLSAFNMFTAARDQAIKKERHNYNPATFSMAWHCIKNCIINDTFFKGSALTTHLFNL